VTTGDRSRSSPPQGGERKVDRLKRFRSHPGFAFEGLDECPMATLEPIDFKRLERRAHEPEIADAFPAIDPHLFPAIDPLGAIGQDFAGPIRRDADVSGCIIREDSRGETLAVPTSDVRDDLVRLGPKMDFGLE
jgi:hypothetical protein